MAPIPKRLSSHSSQPSHRYQRKRLTYQGRSLPFPAWQSTIGIILLTALVIVDLGQNVNRKHLDISQSEASPLKAPPAPIFPGDSPVTSLPSSQPPARQDDFFSSFSPSPRPQWSFLSAISGWLFADNTMNQGDRISLNGEQTVSPWHREGNAVFISDAYLVETVGLELLSTDNASRQPVEWFSDAAQRMPPLETTFDGQLRYLDISQLAQDNGWSLRSQGSVLSIRTPQARIASVRHGRQTWGDRLVIDLDHPTPVQSTAYGGRAVVTLDAQGPSDLGLPDPDQTNTLSAIQSDSSGLQSTITLNFDPQMTTRVWTTPSPPRILIDIRSNNFLEKSIQWQPGLWWKQQIVQIGGAQFPVVFLEITPDRSSNIAFKPIWANPDAMPGIASLMNTAHQWQATAAINAGFFNRNNQLPLGAIRRDGQWYSGPILNRGAIAWNQFSDIQMGRLRLQETLRLSSGQSFPSLYLNSGFVEAGLSRYTSTWGTSYTPLTDFETLIAVENNRVVTKQLVESAGTEAIIIPQNGYLIAARSYLTAAERFTPGLDVQIESVAYPTEFEAYTNIVGAGPLLMQNGQIVLNARAEGFSGTFAQQRAPRSAIARTPEGNIMLITTQKRIGGGGPTLQEMAAIMQQLGSVDALNLDGGNSTSLYLGGRIINAPTQGLARVHNGIGVFIGQ